MMLLTRILAMISSLVSFCARGGGPRISVLVLTENNIGLELRPLRKWKTLDKNMLAVGELNEFRRRREDLHYLHRINGLVVKRKREYRRKLRS